MARIEKTVFISYRRKDISWALAVYQYLTSQKYDVFFDYTHIPSGDFEQIIVSNIKARAHFVLILTPTALDRCSEPGDWLRREIETAMDEKRNIVPLFFDGFNFGSASVAEKLTGKLADVKRYNGLDVPSGYFPEAMERLNTRYLNVPLSAVLHPVSTEVKKVVKDEKNAANKALVEQRQEIKELVKPAKEKAETPKQPSVKKATESPFPIRRRVPNRVGARGEVKWRPYALGVSILLIAALGIAGINSLIQNAGQGEIPSPTPTTERTITLTPKPTNTRVVSTNKATDIPPTSVPTLGIGPTMTGKDGMTLLHVPAGEFTMGRSSPDGFGEIYDDEKPAHTVYLDAFWIDETEVTNAMYANCVATGKCDEPIDTKYFLNSVFKDHPVVYVSVDSAEAYCAYVNRRLPTEAEWEKAARGLGDNTFPWGDNPPNGNLLNYFSTVGTTRKVGLYHDGVSPFGAYDMAGNVSEWVSDWYDSNYYQISPPSNPQGPLSASDRIVRGGNWRTYTSSVRVSRRDESSPSYVGDDVGFRCAMDASE